MPSSTGAPWNITVPVVGDPVAPLQTVFATQATSVHNALNLARGGYVGTDSDRIALTAPDLREGIYWYSTDTDVRWFYNGAAWVTAVPGENLLYPSSVAGTGVTLTGSKVSFSASSTISVNGVFSTAFDNYLIEVVVPTTSTPNGGYFRLRAAGTDYSSSVYGTQQIWNSSATALSSTYSVVPGMIFASVAGIGHRMSIKVSEPATTGLTFISTHTTTQITGGIAKSDISSTVNVVTPADGFSLIASSGTMTGFLKVYGLA